MIPANWNQHNRHAGMEIRAKLRPYFLMPAVEYWLMNTDTNSWYLPIYYNGRFYRNRLITEQEKVWNKIDRPIGGIKTFSLKWFFFDVLESARLFGRKPYIRQMERAHAFFGGHDLFRCKTCYEEFFFYENQDKHIPGLTDYIWVNEHQFFIPLVCDSCRKRSLKEFKRNLKSIPPRKNLTHKEMNIAAVEFLSRRLNNFSKYIERERKL